MVTVDRVSQFRRRRITPRIMKKNTEEKKKAKKAAAITKVLSSIFKDYFCVSLFYFLVQK